MKEGNPDIFRGVLPPPLLVFALLITGIIMNWYKPLSIHSDHHNYLLFIGTALIIVSGLLAFSASQTMRTHRTPVNFRKPTMMILNKGPFKFSRNPLYLSLLMLYGGIGLITNSLWFLPLFMILFLFLRKVILREEKYLEHTFGKQYTLYKSTVRRWI